MIKLRWIETDMEASCLRLTDSKEGASTRAIGLPVVEFLEAQWTARTGTYVFPGQGDDSAFGSFPNHWEKMFANTPLGDITPHVLRHSFASIANDLGFTEVTIAALVDTQKDRSRASIFMRSIQLSSWLRTPSSGYVQGLLDGVDSNNRLRP